MARADGRTALSLMRGAKVQPGQTVVVEAAAGGVGTLLVQLAATPEQGWSPPRAGRSAERRSGKTRLLA